jgi:magnesium-transporting ATPase (P-type)
MITGDYGLTAAAIAQKIGLLKGKSNGKPRVITGEQLSHLSDAQLRQILHKQKQGLVFARVMPEQKLRLVEAYKDLGNIVAVTGDGVNDAPALRAANIGIAMGMNGTDVAREAADIVLVDDNFATIVEAIEQGRAVYQNIRKFITYILASNIAEFLPFLLMVFFKIPPASESQAAIKLKQEGYNELPSSKQRSFLIIAWEIIKDPIFLLLVACGIIYFTLSDIQEALILLG